MDKKLKDYYHVGDTVVDTDTGDRGVVISVTPKVLKVKNQYSTATYTEIKDLMTFKDEIKVIGNISYTLRYYYLIQTAVRHPKVKTHE